MPFKAAAAPPPAPRLSDSECNSKYNASLKCLEKYSKNKSKCEKILDGYKECKKKEKEAHMGRNKPGLLFK